jgi:nucleotide-binding universal stress UspA family protein
MARLLAAVDLGETLEPVVATARYLQGGLGMPAELLHVVPSAYFEAMARGGLAFYLLHRGEVPVLLLPKALVGVKRIAVGLDDSPASLAAFWVAEAWGRALGAEVFGLHLVSGERGCCFPTYLDPNRLPLSQVLEAAKAHLEGLLKATGVVEVAPGERELDLLRLPQDRGADLLILGSKARSTWRHRLGRMVEVLVQESPLPLLVVPEAAVW